MPPIINLVGQKFGRLTVLEQIKDSKYTSWKCRCSCGNIAPATTHNLRANHTKSCGCLQKEKARSCKSTHGMAYTSEYKIWTNIIYRCYNKNDKRFKDYGGRGITVCDEWLNDFMAFFDHVGKRPSPKYSIDRIENDGNYEPGNVRWATAQEQQNNTRQNHHITINDCTKNMTQWAHITGISKSVIFDRLKAGWPPAKAIFTPVRHKHCPIKSG